MMKKLIQTAFLALLLISALPTMAQGIRTPQASPNAKLEQRVGLTDVTVEYARPSAKNRVVFAADGLVPFGEIWRTGANLATKITFSDAVKVGGQELKAGSYAILTTPAAKEWKVMFYPYETGNWGSYVDKTAAATATVPAQKTAGKVETFTIDINNLTNTGANLNIMWENTLVSIPMEVEVDKRVMADIERVMAGPSANDYFAAAVYLHESGKDLEKALEYVQKANSMGEARFWMVRREAEILAAMGRKQDAVAKAQQSLELAKAAQNDDYVRMNEKSIKEWSMK